MGLGIIRKPKTKDYHPEGVMCKDCKHSVCVDKRHDKYYCINPNEKSWLYYGEHVCGKGEQK